MAGQRRPAEDRQRRVGLRRVDQHGLDVAEIPLEPQFGAQTRIAEGADRQRHGLDQLPPDDIKVSSSLGDTPPRTLVIAPFHNNGKVKGVFDKKGTRSSGSMSTRPSATRNPNR